MSNYTKNTDFASKDALLSGNPAKIIKGTEIDTEFNDIATAIGTKADLQSPTLTGTPLAPTAAPGTNTTQIATTAFVAAADTAAVTAERSATATLTNKTVNLTSNTLTGTVAQFNTALSDGDFATIAGTETLTNKTVNLANNTVTGTKALFNTAVSDTDFTFANDFTGASNQSLTSDGFQKLPGGLTLQWGSFTSSGSSQSVTFPTAFATACAYVSVTERENGDTGGRGTVPLLAASLSTTGMTFSVETGRNYHWFAVGY
jgi:hypothetical protein